MSLAITPAVLASQFVPNAVQLCSVMMSDEIGSISGPFGPTLERGVVLTERSSNIAPEVRTAVHCTLIELSTSWRLANSSGKRIGEDDVSETRSTIFSFACQHSCLCLCEPIAYIKISVCLFHPNVP